METRYIMTGVRTVNRVETRVWVAYSEHNFSTYYWSKIKADAILFTHDKATSTSFLRVEGAPENQPDPATIKTIRVKYTPAKEAHVEFPKGF